MKKIVLSNEQIVEICKKMADELYNRFKDSERVPIFLGVMKGALPFMMELIKHYKGQMYIDFIQVSSFQGTESTGTILLKKDVTMDLTGRDVVVIEDIVDTGRTLSYLLEMLSQRKPKSLRLCTLLDKPDRRVAEVDVDYTGFQIPDEFVVGYGLDYAQKYRNLPYIGIVEFDE